MRPKNKALLGLELLCVSEKGEQCHQTGVWIFIGSFKLGMCLRRFIAVKRYP